jgi:hypothetical protein
MAFWQTKWHDIATHNRPGLKIILFRVFEHILLAGGGRAIILYLSQNNTFCSFFLASSLSPQNILTKRFFIFSSFFFCPNAFLWREAKEKLWTGMLDAKY